MKKLQESFATKILLFLLFVSYSYSLDYLNGKIVVKFRKGSTLLENLLREKRSDIMSNFLGDYSLRPALSENLIDFAEKRYFPRAFRTTESPFNHLRQIFIIEFSKKIDPLVLSKKVNNLKDIEYAEPIYTRKLLEVPSDPRVNQQYYLWKIELFNAWDLLPDDTDTIIVGIVDTGVDFGHIDLNNNSFLNFGEIGLDSLGRDKKANGIDDDNNGYVDDYQGWDFVGNDNDPKPVNGHGTHVAGIIGANINNDIGGSGIVPKVKLLACKCSPDNNNSSIINGYEAIFYASVMGASVINCSWGNTGFSNLEQDIINAANTLGSCIVAAAGNNNSFEEFYPASYDGVLSVCAVDSNDVKATFSNFSTRVDVSAPGVDIYSTVPGNTYAAWDGTSMASPISSGVISLIRQKYPNLTPKKCYEVLKRTTDDVNALNPNFIGMIGTGRVNAYKALSSNPDSLKSLLLRKIFVGDPQTLVYQERWSPIALFITLENVLSPLKNVYVKLTNPNEFIRAVYKDSISLGNFETGEIKTSKDSFLILFSERIPYDYNLILTFDVFDENGKVQSLYAQLLVRPSYRTMSGNNITISFNSRGNIGYNDFPNNKQGDGFLFRNSNSLLFEGATMIATSTGKISDVARNSNYQNRAFSPDSFFKVQKNISLDGTSFYFGSSVFSDLNVFSFDSNLVGVKIAQMVYQFSGSQDSNFVILNYKIQNGSEKNYDSVYFGLFFDWDISLGGQKDETFFDLINRFACAYPSNVDTLPFVATQLLSPLPVNYYAIDNDGSEDSFGIYDGFTFAEKILALTSGLGRRKSRTTDVSYVISTGPFSLASGETKEIAFSIFAGLSFPELRQVSLAALMKAIEMGIVNVDKPKSIDDWEFEVFPNTFESVLNIVFFSTMEHEIIIQIIDNIGRFVLKKSLEIKSNRENVISFDLSELARGTYYVLANLGRGFKYKKVIKIK